MPRSYLYNPSSTEPFKLSRSKIELYLKCPRTFYLDRRLGIKTPGMPAFSLNSAVDALLKKEFDMYRKKKVAHPLMEKYGIKAIPFAHPDLNKWRENFKGVQVLHKPTNLLITGAVDDIWINESGELHVVDYKSTSTSAEITLEGEYKEAYKRQAEVYQWLLRMNGFRVSDTAYFLFANGLKTPRKFGSLLKFDEQIIAYEGNAGWVEPVIYDIKRCLDSETLPPWGAESEWGQFVEGAMGAIERKGG
jgi:RecB family exonuclease